METMPVPDGQGQKRTPSSSPHQAPVLWPWMLVIVAWTVALVAALTNQNSLIDHHYLLEESHLSRLLALVVFLACWQVMTVAMMLPSSPPRSRQQERGKCYEYTSCLDWRRRIFARIRGGARHAPG